jgi:hypothetical protein
VDIAGAIASWRASWRRTHNPEDAVGRVLALPWPDQDDVEVAFTEWLAAYREAVEAWSQLSNEAQVRLVQPTRS